MCEYSFIERLTNGQQNGSCINRLLHYRKNTIENTIELVFKFIT